MEYHGLTGLSQKSALKVEICPKYKFIVFAMFLYFMVSFDGVVLKLSPDYIYAEYPGILSFVVVHIFVHLPGCFEIVQIEMCLELGK